MSAVKGSPLTDGQVPVRLVSAVDLQTPMPGKQAGELLVKYWKLGQEGKTWYYVDQEGPNWFEAGDGDYAMQIGDEEWTSEGDWMYEVAASGCATFLGMVHVASAAAPGPSAVEIADAVLARSVAAVEGTAPEHSLCTLVLAALESAIAEGVWTIKRMDGVTPHAVKAVATDPTAKPVTGVS
ncbi:MAG: hypothetical protein JW809_14875 [Pirellulales bacterium]|nr:hypothetical protein [Pirellulales bacterium]